LAKSGLAPTGRKTVLLLATFGWYLSDLATAPPSAKRGSVMPFKAIAFLAIVGLSVLLFVAMRKDNRADAAAGNCYASAQGPSSPTICQ
jgi:hypothetical protein